MGGQSGDAGGYLDAVQDRLCRCGDWYSTPGRRCERCTVEAEARDAARRARIRDQRHRERVAEHRRQQIEHSRETKTYKVRCLGCNELFHTRSKSRLACSNCADSAPGFEEKRADAARRGIGFHLTPQMWSTFVGQPCRYCGDQFNGVRLDRVDSDGAYTLDNVVSCCTPCNMMKGTMPASMFHERVVKIAYRMGPWRRRR